jgi:hypothetical protein
MQTPDEKADAIRSVLWLLEDHYRMVKMGRIGSCIRYERIPDGTERWHPPIIEEFEDWPIERLCRWLARQRQVSKRYRLWAVGLALQKLENISPAQAAAVKAQYVEIPPPNWYEGIERRAGDGIAFMVEDIPGDVPEWGGSRPKSRMEQIADALEEGLSVRMIAKRVGCSEVYVKKTKRTLRERSERTLTAQGIL